MSLDGEIGEIGRGGQVWACEEGEIKKSRMGGGEGQCRGGGETNRGWGSKQPGRGGQQL